MRVRWISTDATSGPTLSPEADVKPSLSRLCQAREFAEVAGVTVRTLDHYDRPGLLNPSYRRDAGYRLYVRPTRPRATRADSHSQVSRPASDVHRKATQVRAGQLARRGWNASTRFWQTGARNSTIEAIHAARTTLDGTGKAQAKNEWGVHRRKCRNPEGTERDGCGHFQLAA